MFDLSDITNLFVLYVLIGICIINIKLCKKEERKWNCLRFFSFQNINLVCFFNYAIFEDASFVPYTRYFDKELFSMYMYI